jgi:uncharacterized protein YkwD
MKKILTAILATVVMAILFGMNVQASTTRPVITNVVQEELRANDSQDLVRLIITTNTVVDTVWVRHSTPERFPRAQLVNATENTKTWEISFTPLNPGSQDISVEANRGFVTGGARHRMRVIHPDDKKAEAEYQAFIDGFLGVINGIRAEHGLNEVYWNENLAEIARMDMAEGVGRHIEVNIYLGRIFRMEMMDKQNAADNYFEYLRDHILTNLIWESEYNILYPKATSIGAHFILQTPWQNRPDSVIPITLAYLAAGDKVHINADPLNIEKLLQRGYDKNEIIDIFEKEVFRLTNIERVNHGVPALIWDERLAIAARAHSVDMSVNVFLGHRGSDGSTIGQRIARTGLRVSSSSENAAYGYISPSELVDAWMHSPGHRRNMLDRSWTHYGGGTYFYIDTNEHMELPSHTQKFAIIR